jgi:DNA-binding transcriptional regulator GbsR (MarR family)
MTLTQSMNEFITHWGEMGARWGINRTIAQIHALLYLSEEPLTAEEIAETLEVARSNVSNSLRELQNWNLVRLQHVKGDRRDHFVTPHDVWDIFVTIGRQRFEREISPTASMLERCVREAGKDEATPSAARERMQDMADFTANLQRWYQRTSELPPGAIMNLFKMTVGLRGLKAGK